MAQVDFSNAVLDAEGTNRVISYGNYLGLYVNPDFFDNSGNYITQNSSISILANTPSKVSIWFTGTFTARGTGFYMRDRGSWVVSNISFNSGDTYSFIIDIETEGNT